MPAMTNKLDVADEADVIINLFMADENEREHDLLGALTKLTAALAANPQNAHAWARVGRLYMKLLNFAQAVPALKTALALQPGLADAQFSMAYALYYLGHNNEACELIDKISRNRHNSHVWAMRAYIHSHVDRDPTKALKVYQDWGRRFADPLTRKAPPLVVQDRNPRKHLKVGYVTADFREHSVAFFMLPVLSHHNPDNVDIHVYSNGRRDAITERFERIAPHWLDIRSLSDDDLCKRIRADGIDVLIDLSGHTDGHRLLAFARRAAPVQVTWIGFNQPLGMKAMDYRLTEANFTPVGHEKYFSETLFRLDCISSYAPPTYAPLCEQPPMLKNGYPTLISLNNSAKITNEMLGIWNRILQARGDARLIIMVKERNADAAQANMQPRIEAAGMPLDRVFVMPQQPLNQFMELGHIADIALDTSPISGGTTTLHALWMGLPVVALDAERAIDAASARTLQSLGLEEDVCQSVDDYITHAVALMGNPQHLTEFRGKSRDILSRSMLMDYASRTTEVEKAFRLMWLNYLNRDTHWRDTSPDMDFALRQCDEKAGNG